MIICMRITISLDGHILEAVRRRASSEGRSVSSYIARVLDDAVKRVDDPLEERAFRLVTVGGGGPYPQIDLDRPRRLLVADDEEQYG